jgi:hypothetical protein
MTESPKSLTLTLNIWGGRDDGNVPAVAGEWSLSQNPAADLSLFLFSGRRVSGGGRLLAAVDPLLRL